MGNVDEFISELQSRKRNVRFLQVERILRRLGFAERRSKKGTSHRVFSHPALTLNVTLASHGKNDVLPIYQVNDVVKALQELKEKS